LSFAKSDRRGNAYRKEHPMTVQQNIFRRYTLVPLLAILCSSWASAQTTRENATNNGLGEPSFERRLIDQAIKDLKVYADGQSAPMQLHIVMRWPNNVRGTTDGATVMLTENGRPAAACCIYTWQDKELHYGFGSLSSKPVSAEIDGESAWHPQEPGVEFHLIPDAPEPTTNALGRLRQMRELSRRFSSRYYESATKFDELRLIPKPIYRYELGKPNGDTELVDGAVFAFAQGTDPESLLLIEARRSASGLQWHYATAKRTVGQINIRLDGQQVHIHKWGGWSRFEPDAIFTTLRRPIQRDE
jgi:hypothetical protein